MKRSISSPQRYAVYTVHGEKCYLCKKPVDYFSFEVDHILPEVLIGQPERLKKVLELFGLASSFDLHSYENWMPSCRPCNNFKRSQVFDPAPIVLIELNTAKQKAAKAAQMAAEVKADRKTDRALALILTGLENGTVSEDTIATLAQQIGKFHSIHRSVEAVGAPMRLSPTVTVLQQGASFEIVRGPHGIGGGPTAASVHPGARCGSCGGHHWNGARCVFCGTMDDGD